MLSKILYSSIIGLFAISLTTIFAFDNNVVEKIIKPSIIKHFKNKNIDFLYIKEMKNGIFIVTVKYSNEQDKITIDKTGKILSIIEDLDEIDDVEEGC